MEVTEEWIGDDEGVAAGRARARNLQPEITEEVKPALKDAGIEMDVFLMIPMSGDAVATFGTVIDPPDEVWARVGEIVCSVLRKTVGLGPAEVQGTGLRDHGRSYDLPGLTWRRCPVRQ